MSEVFLCICSVLYSRLCIASVHILYSTGTALKCDPVKRWQNCLLCQIHKINKWHSFAGSWSVIFADLSIWVRVSYLVARQDVTKVQNCVNIYIC